MGAKAPMYKISDMLSINELIDLYPEIRGLDVDLVVVAHEIYTEEGDLDIEEFLKDIDHA